MSKRIIPRRHRRFIANVECRVRSRRATFDTATVDISKGGICVLSETRLEPYEPVYVTIPMPLAMPLTLAAMVVHQREIANGLYRVGLQLQFFGEFREEPWEEVIDAMNWQAKMTDPLPLE